LSLKQPSTLFALKLDILQDERKEDFSALIRKEIIGGGLVGCSEYQGKRWRAWGTRLVEFFGASKSLFFNMNNFRLDKRNSFIIWPHYPGIGKDPDVASLKHQKIAFTWRLTHSRRTVLDDEDEHIVIVDEEAGRILHKETPSRYTLDREGDALMNGEGEPNQFAPFSSELDWRVAHWAVKDELGHNAFKQLLEISGVSNLAEFL
jgi:hypothetical protein